MGHAPSLSTGEQARSLVLSRRLGRTGSSPTALHARLGNHRAHSAQRPLARLIRELVLVCFEDLQTANMVPRPKPRPDLSARGVPAERRTSQSWG
jgi:hypothetical protein